MERYAARTIDEFFRLGLHGELRQKIGLELGAKVSLMIVDTIVILQKWSDDSGRECVEIDDLGMLTLPHLLKSMLGWKERDKVSSYHSDNIIILKLSDS